jgi:RNA polymerase sigma factor (sigma-70 family)
MKNELSAPVTENLLQNALQYENLLRHILWRYAHNVNDVDELMQDVWVKLLAYKGDSIINIPAYAVMTAQHTACDWLRHKTVVPIELVANIEDLEHVDPTPPADEVLNFQQEIGLLSKAFDTLPRCCRHVFVLKKVYRYSQHEIAHRLKISENTVEQHLSKGIRRIALHLGTPRISHGKLRAL